MPPAFSDSVYAELLDILVEAGYLGESRRAALLGNKMAKLIAALPFLAGCAHPERSALAHLATFELASRGRARALFDHDAADDGSAVGRLSTIAGFEGGDPRIIRRGMALLGLVMLSGYDRDRAKDAASGEYNPLNAGTWQLEARRAELLAEAAVVESAEMDAVLGVDEALRVWWET